MHLFLSALLFSRLAAAQHLELPEAALPKAGEWRQALTIDPPEGWGSLLGVDMLNPSVQHDFLRAAHESNLSPTSLLDARTFDEKASLVHRTLGEERVQRLIEHSNRVDDLTVRGTVEPLLRARREIDRVKEAWNPASVAEALQGEKVSKIFNGDAGSGNWQRELGGLPWVGAEPDVAGYELIQPHAYGSAEVVPKVHWNGLTMLHSREDPLYPKKASVDLLHVGFMEMSFTSWSRRFSEYLSLVRSGGWALLAHSHSYDANYSRTLGVREKVRDRMVEEALATGDWKAHAVFDHGRAPPDYPVTDWWRVFERDNRRRGDRLVESGYDLENFLLILKKK